MSSKLNLPPSIKNFLSEFFTNYQAPEIQNLLSLNSEQLTSQLGFIEQQVYFLILDFAKYKNLKKRHVSDFIGPKGSMLFATLVSYIPSARNTFAADDLETSRQTNTGNYNLFQIIKRR